MKNTIVTKKRFVILPCTACVFVLLCLYLESGQTDYYASSTKNDIQLHLLEQLTGRDLQVKDQDSLASPSKSKITLIKRKIRYYVGDIVTVQINVKDRQGHPKTRGGDNLRIWSKGSDGTGVVGTVVDNGDGTYTGRIKLLWAGNIAIKAKIAAQKEQIDDIFQKIRHGKRILKYYGEFRNGSFIEKVRCTGSQMTSHLWSSSCNLTSMNNDLPWFCQKPKRVPCSSWTFTQTPLPSRSVMEKQAYPWCAHKELIPPGIHVLSEKGQSGDDHPGEDKSSRTQALIPCSRVSPRTTWIAKTPVGYTKEGKWVSTLCSSSFDGSNKSYKSCLKGRRMWLIGDSTTRQLFKYMFDTLSLEMITMKWGTAKWYGFSIAEDHERTFSLVYAVHGLPFYFGPQKVPVKGLNATHTYIDSIPAGSNDIVLVHFYLHFQFDHPEVLRASVRKTASSLTALKQRAPNTTILVKGPHAFDYIPPNALGDFWVDIVVGIYRDEFKSLQNKVIYLDMWEMSVAKENKNRHPTIEIIKMFLDYALSLICS